MIALLSGDVVVPAKGLFEDVVKVVERPEEDDD